MREALLAAYRRHGYEIRCGEMVTRHLRDGTLNREAVLSECASAWKDGRRLDTGGRAGGEDAGESQGWVADTLTAEHRTLRGGPRYAERSHDPAAGGAQTGSA